MRALSNPAATGPKGNRNESIYAKNHIIDRTRCAALRRDVMREERRIRKAEQCRLLHLHDAPIREIAGSEREMSDLWNGLGSGDEKRRRRSYPRKFAANAE